MNQEQSYKRKVLNFSVNRSLQLWMIARVVLVLAGSVLVCSLIYYYFADREITESFQMFHIRARNFLDFLLPVVLGSTLLSLALGVAGSLFLPKPVAGALFGLERELRRIAAGDLSGEVRLRRGDKVSPLADQINLLLASWRQEIASIQEGLGRARQLCVAERHLSPGERLEEVEKIHDFLLTEVSKLKVAESGQGA